MIIEKHPLPPFLPYGAKLLMLGSFPPSKMRWSMDFYYPNLQNDMWRIFGIIFFNDSNYFIKSKEKAFDREKIIEFTTRRGIAIYDTATEVERTKGTAADQDLNVITKTDIKELLKKIPLCKSIITTGGKATEICAEQFGVLPPEIGEHVEFQFEGSTIKLYRLPSTSRAYPMKIEDKAEAYNVVFSDVLKIYK